MTEHNATDRLLLVYCGGTFGMLNSGRGLEAQTDLTGQLTALVADGADRVGRPVAWELAQPQRIIDSAEAGHDTGLEIADLIRQHLAADPTFGGVLVVHGTDTLAHNAAQAAFALLDLDTPIVFTGAQHPLGTPGGDAEQNFADAYAAAVSGAEPGVRLVFGGHSLPAVRSAKRSSEADDGFWAPRDLGTPRAADPELAAAGVTSTGLAESLVAAAGQPAPRVGMLTVVPGLPHELVEAALTAFPAGLVLECYGAGTAPLSGGATVEVLRAAQDRGTPVVAITRCVDGAVDLPRYAVGAQLAEAGVVGGSDLTAEAAISKLRALVRAGFSGAELTSLLRLNLIGEQRPA